jgi:hypothetical protein
MYTYNIGLGAIARSVSPKKIIDSQDGKMSRDMRANRFSE